MSNTYRSDFKYLIGAIALTTLRTGGHSLYLGINGTAPWENENVPPAPNDTAEEQHEFWNHITGFVKIPQSKIWSCIKNNPWIQNKTFELFDPAKPTRKQYRYYTVNSNFEVYQCVGIIMNAENEFPLAKTEPKGHNNGNTIDTLDGYQWRYLYKVKREDLEFKTSEYWIPVYNPHNDIIPEDQILYGDSKSEHISNMHHLACRVDLTEQTKFMAQVGYVPFYRQIGLFIDIRNATDIELATGDVLTPDEVLTKSGYLIYTENLKKTRFSDTVTDKINIVVEL
jgi:hypothetical protein